MMDTDPDLKLVNTTQNSTAMDRNTFACHDFKTHGSSFQQHSPSMLKLKDETFITPNGLNHFKHHCLKPCYVKLTKLETIPSHKISCFVKYGGNTSNNVDIPCKPTPVNILNSIRKYKLKSCSVRLDRVLVCSFCSEYFFSNEALDEHEQTHFKDSQEMPQCFRKKKTTRDHNLTTKIYNNANGARKRKSIKSKKLKNNVLYSNVEPNKKNMNFVKKNEIHMNSDLDYSNRCKCCFYSFSTTLTLKTHLRTSNCHMMYAKCHSCLWYVPGNRKDLIGYTTALRISSMLPHQAETG